MKKISPNNSIVLTEKIKEYKRLISNMAYKYVRGRAEYEDLIQEAFVGLVIAGDNFDESRSEDFRTYAITRMRGKMYEYGIRNDTLISIPTHVAKAVSYVRQISKLLDKELPDDKDGIKLELLKNRRCPTLEKKLSVGALEKLDSLKQRLENIARNSKISYETLAGLAIDSLSSIVAEDSLFKHSVDEPDGELNAIDNQLMKNLEIALGEKQFFVVRLRLLGCSYREIAEKLSEAGYKNSKGKQISRQAVKGILDSARKTIKELNILPSMMDGDD